MEFYFFYENLAKNTLHAAPQSLTRQPNNFPDEVLCLATGIYDKIEFPVKFMHKYGFKLEDILRTGHPCLFLISDRLRGVLEANCLSGWCSFPIVLLDKNGKSINGYNGFSATGRTGPFDFNSSFVFEKPLFGFGEATKFYRGLYINETTWDGSDFFMAEAYYSTIVSQRAADALLNAGVSNLELRKLSSTEMMCSAVNKQLRE